MKKFHLITRPEQDAIALAQLLRIELQSILINPLLEINFSLNELSKCFQEENLEDLCFIVTSVNSLRAIKKLQASNLASIKLIMTSDICLKEAEGLVFRSILKVGEKASDLEEFFHKNYDSCTKYIYLCGENVTLEINKILSDQGLTSSKMIVYKAKALSLNNTIIENFKNHLIGSVSLFSCRTAQIFIEEVKRNNLDSYLVPVTLFTISQKTAKLLNEEFPLSKVVVNEYYSNSSMSKLILQEG